MNFVTFFTIMPRFMYILTSGVISSSCSQLYVWTKVLNCIGIFSSRHNCFIYSDMCEEFTCIRLIIGGNKKDPNWSRTWSGVITSARTKPKTSSRSIAANKESSVSEKYMRGISVGGTLIFFLIDRQSHSRTVTS